MGWRTIGVSVEGGGHRRRGGGCQDALRVEHTDRGVVLAVADGAGSALLGATGARLAVDVAARLLVGAVRVDMAAMAVALGSARAELERVAFESDVTVAHLATTIHLVAIDERRITTAQIGDGAVVARRLDGTVVSLDPVERGEYLNETVFLTSAAWADEVRLGDHDARSIDALAVLTDGLQLLAFELAANVPHAGFFEPMWRWASSVEGCDGTAELAAFLGSDRVQSRTDDDTTLVLAVRG